jgi:H+-transporting ATPase
MKTNADQPNTGEPHRVAKTDTKDELKSLPMPELQKRLDASPDGLSQAEANRRLLQYGPNEIAEKKANPFLKLLSYFWGPIPWMIEAAVVLSAMARHWPDFGIILLLLLANAVVGLVAVIIVDCGLRVVHDPPRLGLGGVRLGLCPGVVPIE